MLNLKRLYKKRLRSRAIQKAKAKLAMSNVLVSELSEQQLKDVLASEEAKIKEDQARSGVIALLALIGFGAI
tara:strand:+ start:762 stop:977 length:216 start_codon:yes stop_codon:yes gene_type:complete